MSERCGWVGLEPIYIDYHDTEWGVPEYDSRAFMFDAALSGQAVILADLRMTAADVAAGSLVRLSPIEVDRPQGVYVVSEAKPTSDPRLDVFADWMKREANK